MNDTTAQIADADQGAPEPNESEVKARRLGWVPKEEFRGDPDKHRSAEDFLERGTTILPILQKDNERLHSRLNEMETTLRETREASKELLEFTSKSEQRAYERAKADIEARIEEGAASADPTVVRQGMRDLDALNKEQVKPAPKVDAKPAVAGDPIIQDWIGKNEWFTKSPVLGSFATETFGDLERAKPGASKAELLAETERKTREKFPEKFGINPMRDGASSVATPSGQAAQRKPGKKTYDDLPADAKAACTKFMRTIPGYTREKYVADYEWND